jgi:hypothetical protein
LEIKIGGGGRKRKFNLLFPLALAWTGPFIFGLKFDYLFPVILQGSAKEITFCRATNVY